MFAPNNISGLVDAFKVWSTSGAYGMAFHSEIATVLHNRNFMMNDFVHPNESGAKALAQQLASLIRYGSGGVCYDSSSAEITPTEGWVLNSDNSTPKIYENIQGQVKRLLLLSPNDNIFFAKNAENFQVYGTFVIAKCKLNLFRGSFSNLAVKTTATFVGGEENYVCGVNLFFKDDLIYLGVPHSGQGINLIPKNLTNFKGVLIENCGGTFPMFY